METFYYQYRDESGKVLYEKIKEVKNGEKSFRFDKKLDNSPKVLYRYPELLQGLKEHKIIFITEGEKDVDTLKSMGFTATCNFDGGGSGKWRDEYDSIFTNATVAIVSDIDEKGRELAQDVISHLNKVAQCVICIDIVAYGEKLPSNGDISDLVQAVGKDAVRSWLDAIIASPKDQEGVTVYPNLWYHPNPLIGPVVIPEFQSKWLPDIIRHFSESLAASVQVSVEMVACIALSVISFIASKHYVVLVRDGWYEPPNIFTIIAAESGERKSAVMSKVVRPLLQYESQWNKEHEGEILRSRIEHKSMEKALSELKKKALLDETSQAAYDEALHLFEKHKELHNKQLVADDVTVEKAVTIMKQNNEKLMIVSSENSFLSTALGRYSNQPNIDILLKGYSAEMISVDRQTRESDHLDHAFLTICVATQPYVAKELYANELFIRRGLLARFLLCCPQSTIGNRSFDVPPMDSKLSKVWTNLCFNLLRNIDESDCKIICKLSQEAKGKISEFYEALETKLGEDDNESLRAFDAKLCGHVCRLALILHVSEYPSANDMISKENMEHAIEMGWYFRDSFIAMMESIGADSETQHAVNLLKRLKASQQKIISARDLGRLMQSLSTEQRDQVIARLVNTGWIRPIKPNQNALGRKRKMDYEVNPLLSSFPSK